MPERPTLLFVCVHNAGRSQMAAAWARALGRGRVEALSAGSAPAEALHPEVVAAMREVGIDLSAERPKVLEPAVAHRASVVVTMGCGDACPVVPGVRREDWPLPDPKGRSPEEVRRIRDELRRRVEDLLAGLGLPEAEAAVPPALEASLRPGGAHARLLDLVGAWEGTVRTWLEPGVLFDESPIHGTFRPVLGGRFVLHEYRASIHGEPLEGVAIHGHDLAASRAVACWVDSWHNGTAIMRSEGPAGGGPGHSVLGSYPDPAGGPPWGWRTTIEQPGPDEVVITHWNVTPAGEEAKAVEIRYARA